MKKCLSVLALAVLLCPAAAQQIMKEGVMMKGGKMVVVKDGQMTAMDHEMTMGNGVKVMSDGTMVKGDKKIKMKDGMMLNMNGQVLVYDGVMMEDGKMLVVKEGQAAPMDKDITLLNGTKIMMDGTVVSKNGKQKKLPNGAIINVNWKKLEAKKTKTVKK